MTPERLIQMANQIGSYFAAYPDPAEARSEIAGHLKKFWSPDMRQSLLTVVDQADPQGLQPLVAEAVREHQSQLQPRR